MWKKSKFRNESDRPSCSTRPFARLSATNQIYMVLSGWLARWSSSLWHLARSALSCKTRQKTTTSIRSPWPLLWYLWVHSDLWDLFWLSLHPRTDGQSIWRHCVGRGSNQFSSLAHLHIRVQSDYFHPHYSLMFH